MASESLEAVSSPGGGSAAARACRSALLAAIRRSDPSKRAPFMELSLPVLVRILVRAAADNEEMMEEEQVVDETSSRNRLVDGAVAALEFVRPLVADECDVEVEAEAQAQAQVQTAHGKAVVARASAEDEATAAAGRARRVSAIVAFLLEVAAALEPELASTPHAMAAGGSTARTAVGVLDEISRITFSFGFRGALTGGAGTAAAGAIEMDGWFALVMPYRRGRHQWERARRQAARERRRKADAEAGRGGARSGSGSSGLAHGNLVEGGTGEDEDEDEDAGDGTPEDNSRAATTSLSLLALGQSRTVSAVRPWSMLGLARVVHAALRDDGGDGGGAAAAVKGEGKAEGEVARETRAGPLNPRPLDWLGTVASPSAAFCIVAAHALVLLMHAQVNR